MISTGLLGGWKTSANVDIWHQINKMTIDGTNFSLLNK